MGTWNPRPPSGGEMQVGDVRLLTIKSHSESDGWCWYATTPDQFGNDGDATLSSGRFFETDEAARTAAVSFITKFAQEILQQLTPAPATEDGLTEAEQRAQGQRCGCRGADDYCGCQNVPDAETRRQRAATQEAGHAD